MPSRGPVACLTKDWLVQALIWVELPHPELFKHCAQAWVCLVAKPCLVSRQGSQYAGMLFLPHSNS